MSDDHFSFLYALGLIIALAPVEVPFTYLMLFMCLTDTSPQFCQAVSITRYTDEEYALLLQHPVSQ